MVLQFDTLGHQLLVKKAVWKKNTKNMKKGHAGSAGEKEVGSWVPLKNKKTSFKENKNQESKAAMD